MNNSMVAHLWANEKQENASGSNFFFEGKSIYSFGYHFEVGRIVRNKRGEKAYLMNKSKYQIDCTGTYTERHKHLASGAIPNEYPTFYMYELPPKGESTGRISFVVQCLESIRDCAYRYKKCRTELYHGSLWHYFRSLMDYIKFYDMETPDQLLRKSADQWLGMHHKLSCKSDKEKQEHVRELKRIFQIMLDHQGFESVGAAMNIVDDICGEGTYEAYLSRVEAHNKREAKREYEILEAYRYEQEIKSKSLEEKIELWKEGKIHSFSMPYLTSDDKPNAFLRITKNKIETSKGITLSKGEARRLWALIKMFHQGHPFRHDLALDANGYKWKLNKYENDMLTAGCHRISYTEMESIAMRLGF